MQHNMGIIGFGGMAEYHYNTVKREDINMPVLAVFDIREKRRARAEELGLKAYDNLEDFLADKRFDLVLVATANNEHCRYVCAALEAGYNVICEKPAAMNAAEVEKMIATSEKTGKFFTTHQNRRFDADFRLMKKVLDSKVLGDPYLIQSTLQSRDGSGSMYEWRGMLDHGGGMLRDWGVHELDQLLWYIDKTPKTVYANIIRLNSEETDDYTKLIMTFDDGMVVQMEVATYSPLMVPRWSVYGRKGAAIIDRMDSKEAKIRTIKKSHEDIIDATAYDDYNYTFRKQKVFHIDEFEESTVDMSGINYDWGSIYLNLKDVLDGKDELLVKPYQILRVIRVIDAAFKSAETGETVKLSD